MRANSDGPGQALERFRAYLTFVARKQLDPRLQGQVDLSGVIQQTFLEAFEGWADCPVEETARAAWLRRILVNNLADEIRGLRTAKRDRGRERSLEAALEATSARLDVWLAAEQSTPSEHAQREEEELRLAELLACLPEAQREALALQHWHGWSLAQIAEHLGRSPAAVAGLIKRGLRQLRTQWQDQD